MDAELGHEAVTPALSDAAARKSQDIEAASCGRGCARGAVCAGQVVVHRAECRAFANDRSSLQRPAHASTGGSPMTSLRASRVIGALSVLVLALGCTSGTPPQKAGETAGARTPATTISSRCSASGARSSSRSSWTACRTTPPGPWPRSSGAAGVSAASRRDRSERLADRPAGRLSPRPRRDERSRLRSPRAASRGRTTRPSTSRSSRARATSHCAKGRSRTARSSSGATSLPLSDADAAKVAPGVRAIPKLLEQAKTNLVGNRQGSLDVRHVEHQGPERRPGAAGLAGDAAAISRPISKRRRRRPTVSPPGSTARRRRRPGRPGSASTTTTGT